MTSISASKSLKVMPKPTSANYMRLTPDEIKFYWDNGYLVVKNLFNSQSLDSYRRRFLQYCNGEVGRGNTTMVREPSLVKTGAKGEDLINKIQDILYDDVLCRYPEDDNLLSILSQIIGENITAMHSMLINKPGGSARHPPHQDLYYFPFRPADSIVAAWTAIDQVTIENGCLFVIPESHKAKELYGHGNLKDSNYLYHGILDELKVAPLDKRVNLPMSPGDTVFFHPLLVHGSGPNVTKKHRKSISCHFANSELCRYVEVRRTGQESIAREIEGEAKRRGFDVSFQDIWILRSKQVKGARCNL